MPWWSWVVIWVVLTLGLLAMFVTLGVMLYRKVRALFSEVAALTSTLDVLGRAEPAPTEAAPVPALLRKWAEVAADRSRVREASEARRESRRQARVARAKALTRVDAARRTWFGKD